MANEVRCSFCNKLLIRDNEIKCPRCKELVKVFKVGEEGLKIAWPDNKQNLGELQSISEKWPPELQKEFLGALDIFQKSLVATHQKETPEENVKVIVRPAEIFSGSEIWRLASTLKKYKIIPNLKYLREDMEYFKLGLQLVNFFAGINQPDGEKVPLVNIYGFMHEPGVSEKEPVKAGEPIEAYLMAFWERNMGRFDYTYHGKRVWELKDREAKRNAIIVLTKRFCKKLQNSFCSN
jgi:phage FluMu protein Com